MSQMLSWQSCFWAIVPIVLNTMCQSSGRILGYDAKHSFALRSSPVVCAANVVDTLVQLRRLCAREPSFAAALQALIDVRFKGAPQGSEDGSFEALRKNQAFRVILFVFGAAPQMIKLYACNGIPWTKAYCTAYIASFFLDETLATMASLFRISGGKTTDQASPSPQGRQQLYSVWTRAVLLSSYAAVYLVFATELTMLVELGFNEHGVLLLLALALFVISSLPTMFLQMTQVSIEIQRQKLAGTVSFSFLAWTIPSFVAAVFIWSFWMFPFDFGRGNDVVMYCMTWIAGVGFLIVDETELEKLGQPFSGLGKYFVVLHFSGALLYYTIRYDSSSTYKPAWTDYLG